MNKIADTYLDLYELSFFLNVYLKYRDDEGDVYLEQNDIMDNEAWIWDVIFDADLLDRIGFSVKKIVLENNEYSIDEYLSIIKANANEGDRKIDEELEGKLLVWTAYKHYDSTNRMIDGAGFIFEINQKKAASYFNSLLNEYVANFKSNRLVANSPIANPSTQLEVTCKAISQKLEFFSPSCVEFFETDVYPFELRFYSHQSAYRMLEALLCLEKDGFINLISVRKFNYSYGLMEDHQHKTGLWAQFRVRENISTDSAKLIFSDVEDSVRTKELKSKFKGIDLSVSNSSISFRAGEKNVDFNFNTDSGKFFDLLISAPNLELSHSLAKKKLAANQEKIQGLKKIISEKLKSTGFDQYFSIQGSGEGSYKIDFKSST